MASTSSGFAWVGSRPTTSHGRSASGVGGRRCCGRTAIATWTLRRLTQTATTGRVRMAHLYARRHPSTARPRRHGAAEAPSGALPRLALVRRRREERDERDLAAGVHHRVADELLQLAGTR